MDCLENFFCCFGLKKKRQEQNNQVVEEVEEAFFKPYTPPKKPIIVRVADEIKDRCGGGRDPTQIEVESFYQLGKELAAEEKDDERDAVVKRVQEQTEMLQKQLPFAEDESIPTPNIFKQYNAIPQMIHPQDSKKNLNNICQADEIERPKVICQPPPFITSGEDMDRQKFKIYLRQMASSIYPSDEESMDYPPGTWTPVLTPALNPSETKMGSPKSPASLSGSRPFTPVPNVPTMGGIDEILARTNWNMSGELYTQSNVTLEDILDQFIDVPLTPPSSVIFDKPFSVMDSLSVQARLFKEAIPYMDLKDYSMWPAHWGPTPKPEPALIPLAARFRSPVASTGDLNAPIHRGAVEEVRLPEPAMTRGEGSGHPDSRSGESAAVTASTVGVPSSEAPAQALASNITESLRKGSENLAKNMSKGFSYLRNSFWGSD